MDETQTATPPVADLTGAPADPTPPVDLRRTLDKSRDFGTVYPPFQGAHFEQDGAPFDAQGREVIDTPDPEPVVALNANRHCDFGADELEAMHTNTIKKLVREANGDWPGEREDAIRWLLGTPA